MQVLISKSNTSTLLVTCIIRIGKRKGAVYIIDQYENLQASHLQALHSKPQHYLQHKKTTIHTKAFSSKIIAAAVAKREGKKLE